MIILYIIAFLLGVYVYTNHINFIIHGPDSNKIKKKIYKFGNKYYKFVPELVIGHQF